MFHKHLPPEIKLNIRAGKGAFFMLKSGHRHAYKDDFK